MASRGCTRVASIAVPVVAFLLVPALSVPDFGMEEAVRAVSGPIGLGLIFVYSFLIAFILPGVSEVVLLADLSIGLPRSLELAVIILVSGVGKAAGSVLAFHIGQEAKESGPVTRWLRQSRIDIVAWSESTAMRLARRYGYIGLAAALSVPGFPDTISIYAFAVLDRDYVKFSIATFVGSVGRLLVTLAGVEAVLWFA